LIGKTILIGRNLFLPELFQTLPKRISAYTQHFSRFNLIVSGFVKCPADQNLFNHFDNIGMDILPGAFKDFR
jgi:hypothetical protein